MLRRNLMFSCFSGFRMGVVRLIATIEINEGERALERPCLLYHIKRCQGPCIDVVSKEDYAADIEQVMLFLDGHQEQESKALQADMETAAENLEFERAAALRDKIRAIERTTESQKMAGFAKRKLDVLGYARSGKEAAVQLFGSHPGPGHSVSMLPGR